MSGFRVALLALLIGCVAVEAHPLGLERYKFSTSSEESMNLKLLQLAEWINSKFRRNNIDEAHVPMVLYKVLPLLQKRNSEAANTIIAAEETQKMYNTGRK